MLPSTATIHVRLHDHALYRPRVKFFIEAKHERRKKNPEHEKSIDLAIEQTFWYGGADVVLRRSKLIWLDVVSMARLTPDTVQQ